MATLVCWNAEYYISSIKFIKGIPPNLDDASFLDVNTRNFIVLDDLVSEVGEDQWIVGLFTKGSRHRNLSAIVPMQNFY